LRGIGFGGSWPVGTDSSGTALVVLKAMALSHRAELRHSMKGGGIPVGPGPGPG